MYLVGGYHTEPCSMLLSVACTQAAPHHLKLVRHSQVQVPLPTHLNQNLELTKSRGHVLSH